MRSEIRIVKRQIADESLRVNANGSNKSEQQRNREIVGVIKSWIEEFKLRGSSRSKAALVLLNK
jgi:hypothetical protein